MNKDNLIIIEGAQPFFNSALSSFKFTDQSTPHSTEVRKTYNNSTYGITFMYPSDGIVNNKPSYGEYDISITVNTKNLVPLLHVGIENSRDDLIKINESELDKWYVLSVNVY